MSMDIPNSGGSGTYVPFKKKVFFGSGTYVPFKKKSFLVVVVVEVAVGVGVGVYYD